MFTSKASLMAKVERNSDDMQTYRYVQPVCTPLSPFPTGSLLIALNRPLPLGIHAPDFHPQFYMV